MTHRPSGSLLAFIAALGGVAAVLTTTGCEKDCGCPYRTLHRPSDASAAAPAPPRELITSDAVAADRPRALEIARSTNSNLDATIPPGSPNDVMTYPSDWPRLTARRAP